MEIINIYDSSHNLIGTSTKNEAHQKGLWHEVFACLFIDSKKNKVYLQYKNSDHNDLSNNNKIDISVGGHLIKDETKENGIREIKEESGLIIDYKELIYLGKRIIDKYINENYIIREFDYLHILDREFNLQELKSYDDEVLYYIEFDIDELLDFFINKKDTIKGITPDKEISYTINDFIKGYLEDDKLYINYLLLAKKLINKEDTIEWKNN